MTAIFERLISFLTTRLALVIARVFHALGWLSQYQPLPNVSFSGSKLDDRIKGRLQAIEANLPRECKVGMDIGCNNGYYAISLSSPERLIFGVEGGNVPFQIFIAAKRVTSGANVVPVNIFLDPDNVSCLPECDFMVHMAVFHHWARAYGEERALEMLASVLEKTRQSLFFETPFAADCGPNYSNVLPDRNSDDPKQWWDKWFTDQGWSMMVPIFEQNRVLYRVDRVK